MNGWGEYVAAFAVFFGSHSLPTRPGIKARLVRLIGPGGFTLAYSALSVAVLTWLIIAAERAPVVVLWPLTEPLRWLTLGLMLLASVLFALAIGRPNPLSFGGGDPARFDPEKPGIVGWMRHPLLWVLALWSGAHLLSNGTLAHVILFGSFFAFSFLGMALIDRRRRRQMGPEWERLRHLKRQIAVTPGGMVRLVAGIILYGLILWAHGPVIGVAPLG